MLNGRNDINFIESDTYFTSIIQEMGIEEEKITAFRIGFEKFFHNQENNVRTLPHLIIKIRSYMKEHRADIQKHFSGTILSNYDCLTQCILAGYIGEKLGYRMNLARPQEFHRYYHTLLVDENNGKYKMAGKRKVTQYQIIGQQEAVKQLQLTHPIVCLGNRILSSTRQLLGTKKNPF